MLPDSSAAPGSDWDAERVTLGRHFVRDMEGLWGGVLKLAAVVEDALEPERPRPLRRPRRPGRRGPASRSATIDRWEVQIERDCLKVLALHQPVASDLRRVAAVLKINGDLERIGRPGAAHRQARQEARGRPPRVPDPAGAGVDGDGGARAGPRQPRRPDQGRRRLARAVIAGDRRDRPPLPRRS